MTIKLSIVSALFMTFLGLASAHADSTYTAMYFHSQVRDASACSMHLAPDGTIVFGEGISNPAATCPDAFAWKSLLETVSEEFWTQWANDETVWVTSPKPRCTSDSDSDCCFVNPGEVPLVGYKNRKGKVIPPQVVGGPGELCPYIPGNYGGSAETHFAGAKPITSHNTTFLRSQDPAFIAREREAEIVYRNDAFVEYTTSEELYSRAGLAKLFERVSGEAANSLPYRPTGQGASYPTDALMFKVDWVPEKTMVELGYVSDHDNDPSTPPQDADYPFVTMKISARHGKSKPFQQGLFYLVAITGASKALPNWHWFAFEHARNLGRCDYTGCNDSYGFKTTVSTPSPTDPDHNITFASNFITVNTQPSQLDDGFALFDLGKRYPPGEVSPGLAALLAGTKIGDGANPVRPNRPQVSDPAWRSYRLKGTQTTFYNNDGYPTIVGASTEEGGFDNTSSCMSCHVQSAVNAQGKIGTPGIGLSGRLNLSGINSVVNGHPVTADYYARGTTIQRAVRADFVWGILFAQ